MNRTADDQVRTGRPVRPGRRWRGWRPATWLLLTSAVFVELGVTYLAGAYVFLLYAGACREPATAADLHRAQLALVMVAVAACLPWLPAVWRTRHRLRVAGFAIAAVSVPVSQMTWALVSSPEDWTQAWMCF